MERKEVTLFHLGIFGLCRWAREGQGPVLFLLGFCTTWTPGLAPTPVVARGGPTAFGIPPQQRLMVMVACTMSPGLLPLLSAGHPSAPASCAPAPPQPPPPSSQRESCQLGWAGRWPGAQGAGRPDRVAVTCDIEAVPSAFSSQWPSHPPHRVCGQCRTGVWVFCFFSSSFFFQRWGIDQSCSVYAWNWMERLWNSCGGPGGHQQPNRRAVSGPVFIFKNRQARQWSLCPTPGRGDSRPPSSLPHWNLRVLP